MGRKQARGIEPTEQIEYILNDTKSQSHARVRRNRVESNDNVPRG